MIKSALLVLEDGTQFYGRSVGAPGVTVGELVFNTSMTGYQEILTDPSYFRQIITLTYPHIGNVGTNASDAESTRIHAHGLIIRDLSPVASSWRNEESLPDWLKRHNLVAIADIDTRKLTNLLREKGAQNGCIIAREHSTVTQQDVQMAREKACAFTVTGMDFARAVSTKEPYTWSTGSLTGNSGQSAEKAHANLPWHVVVYDYGVKQNMLRMLVDRGCRLTVVPAATPAEEVLNLNPHGIFLSNGPGDPGACDYAITAIRQLLKTDIPLFGICLGHQLLALASGAKTIKMKFGHRGSNHPVKNIDSGAVMITAQNHGFAVDSNTLPSCLRSTHQSLFDGSLQGIARTDRAAFGFQGHPEASPGPHDAAILFDHFIALMNDYHCQHA